MSMTTEQVKRLRDAANRFDAEGAEPSDGDLMREAANTIEALSAKVQAANMERSTAYYNGGWIPVKERLPEENKEVLICLEWGIDIGSFRDGEWHSEWINHYDDGDVLAWMPLPEPYREDGE